MIRTMTAKLPVDHPSHLGRIITPQKESHRTLLECQTLLRRTSISKCRTESFMIQVSTYISTIIALSNATNAVVMHIQLYSRMKHHIASIILCLYYITTTLYKTIICKTFCTTIYKTYDGTKGTRGPQLSTRRCRMLFLQRRLTAHTKHKK